MTISHSDYSAFADFEKEAWVKLPAHYDTMVGPMTRQAVNAILDALDIRSGTALLDVATGPGYVAAEALRRGADPLGIDFAPDMIAEARRMFPVLKVEQGDAENLGFPDDSFDAVSCAFGLLHFPRPGKAVAEAYRVLRPGRPFAFTVWVGPTANKFFRTIGEVILKHADPSVLPPKGPNQFMLSDPMVSVALMDASRFTDVRVSEIPCHFTMREPGDMLDFMKKCAVRGVFIYDRQVPEVKARIEQALKDEGAKAMAEDQGRVPCPILLVTGTKPAR